MPLREGEEIFISYFDTENNRTARQEMARQWGFECLFDVCSLPADHSSARDADFRKLWEALDDVKNAYGKKMDAKFDEAIFEAFKICSEVLARHSLQHRAVFSIHRPSGYARKCREIQKIRGDSYALPQTIFGRQRVRLPRVRSRSSSFVSPAPRDARLSTAQGMVRFCGRKVSGDCEMSGSAKAWVVVRLRFDFGGSVHCENNRGGVVSRTRQSGVST
jgi:hypothetical protein